MRNWLGLATLALAVALTGCTPKEFDMDVVQETLRSPLQQAGLQFYWSGDLPLQPGETVTNIWLIDDAVYYLTSRQRLFCCDAAVGTLRWSYAVPERSHIYPPCHGPDINITPQTMGIQGLVPQGVLPTVTYRPVAFNTTRVIYILDRMTGQEVRRIDVQPAAMSTGGAFDSRNYFAPLLDGTYVGYDLQEGVRTGWRGTIADSKHGVITAPVQYLDGHVYVAATNGLLHCRIVDEKGRLEWSPRNLVASVTAAPLVDRRFLLVPVGDGRLYAIDPLTGMNKWFSPFTAKNPLTTSPQAGMNTIFQYSCGDRFYAIDMDKGKAKWEHPTAKTVVSIFQNVVYAVSTDNTLLAMTEITGEVRHEISMLGFKLFAPNTGQNAAIYAVSENGRITCIRPASAGRLTVDAMR